MSSVSLFVPINYERSASFGEQTLSLLSNYFYLGGQKVTVLENNQLRLEEGEQSWSKTALKVVSYVALFPLTLALFALNLALRSQHDFTIVDLQEGAAANPLGSDLSPDEKTPPTGPISPPLPKSDDSSFEVIKPIDQEFTTNTTIEDQRKAHESAKKYLQKSLTKLKSQAEVFFVSPSQTSSLSFLTSTVISTDLDSSIFTWERTEGVADDIQRDAKIENRVVLYGVASQFNGAEATGRFTNRPGEAVEAYKQDHTQGPFAQLQFPDCQVEIINNGANLGFNGLCNVFDEATKTAVQHGYLTPETSDCAKRVIQQLRENGHKMEFLCVGNVPKGKGNTQKVYEMMVAAPAFGPYSKNFSIEAEQQFEIEFLCALQGYRAQFQQVIELARSFPEKKVIFKPTGVGLGVFGNNPENVAKGFYVAAKEHESQLREKNIHVRLQSFRGQGPVQNMANSLNLQQFGE